MSTSPEVEAPKIELGMMHQQIGVLDETEDWSGITNPTERRKLQNRINQRAYRTRKRVKDPSSALDTLAKRHAQRKSALNQGGHRATSPPNEPSITKIHSHEACSINFHPRIRAIMEQFAQHAYERYSSGAPVLAHLPLLVQFNAISALVRNATTLGVLEEFYMCDSISGFNKQGPDLGTTSPYSMNCPTSLHPTPLQIVVEHHPWIDLFPSPRMRDNILHALETVEDCDKWEDDLCHDVCQYNDAEEKAGLIVWGDPGDPLSWEASPGFLKKWGYLLNGCVDIIRATNYWRRKRGEKPLSFRDVANFIMASRPKELVELQG
ncbi:hypothetical protein B0J11DRAFT_574440 [Dendryphion nanum]|uniref:BZIP domain-containing protein n=1 Tax=Dendryphion nanum TaxID=256645 RepID=A0A9P9EJ74_9PLEO|nr:hypothetical protein B0J11DRAFT_574440 [Dendryphion nanum]